ncbi:hypothetical protein BJV74DRAFT_396736 [Russula compacta]|nr:hypothetical protein BJV74DRAFT_396736 [Russula compacta]
MRSCLKHHSPSFSPASSTSMATPPPTRSPTPPLIPPDTPSLALKRRPSPSLTEDLSRRCVHFCSELVDKVFVADEWDRSPAGVTPRLTYQDMLELKEIQRSLPHATQPLDDPDLPELNSRGVPRTHFLNTVPVGLVPLISPATLPTSRTEPVTTTPCKVSPLKVESPPCHSPPSRPPPSPPSTPPPKVLVTVPPLSQNPSPSKSISPPAPIVEPWVPPHLPLVFPTTFLLNHVQSPASTSYLY